MTTPRAWCFDLDGTLYQGDGALPGAREVLAALRARGVPFRCLSNTTSRSRATLARRLAGYGLDVRPEEILTATRAGAAWVEARGFRRVAAFVPEETRAEIPGALEDARTGPADAVVVGDLREGWTAALLQAAFEHLMGRAAFVALSRDRSWHDGTRLVMDCGAYVAALEYATGREATVVGKPSPDFFRAALLSLGGDIAPADVVMVGDDVRSDVGGAQGAGMRGWLVRTGKYDAAAVAASGVTPDRVVRGVDEVLALLG